MMVPRLEVAEVFRGHESKFLTKFGYALSADQRRALRDVIACRTSALGGHVERCDDCGHQRIAYKSCRNRHCPKCQAMARAKWLDARAAELLPIPYFHVVFTLPDALGPIALQNKRVVYDILFKAAAETLKDVAANPRHLGAEIGILAVLHTWGSNLMHHPHLHCVVSGGGLARDHSRWVHCKRSRKRKKVFFAPVRILSRVFRGKFIHLLKQAFHDGKLEFHGRLAPLSVLIAFEKRVDEAVRNDWVVFAKRPFSSAQRVLKYLARYTHRVAISNQRLRSMQDGRVRFRWKDYGDHGKQKEMELEATEFMRRFLMHVLPTGFVRIRHYGYLANRHRQKRVALCRKLLGHELTCETGEDLPNTDDHGQDDARIRVTCPVCKRGAMIIIDVVEPHKAHVPPPRPLLLRGRTTTSAIWDTS